VCRDRLGDLEGALNPEAEATATQRYKQAKAQLQGKLRDQLRLKMEHIDEHHASLQYARQFSELCAAEAKVVLTRSALLAGDYDAQLTGVYGDSVASGNQDSELIPLLRQLIAMLESGGPFYLSPELLNILQGGGGGGASSHTTNINITGAGAGRSGGDQMRSKQQQQQQQQQQKTKSKLVKSSTDQDTERDKGQSSSSTVVVIGDMSRAKQQSDTPTDQELSDRKKFLFEKQAYEAAKLENDLHGEEVEGFENLINDFEKKKSEAKDEVAKDFADKLARAKTEQEKEKIMVDYANNMTKLTSALEKQKQQQLADLREKLLDRRRQRKKKLHHEHIAEAQKEGVGVEEVPDITLLTRDQMEHDLKVKQGQAEHNISMIKSASMTSLESVSH
jgi:hypothetical protein